MKYVIGIDLGTSAVKILLVNEHGHVKQEVSKPLTLIQEKSGYSEQNPEEWVEQTVKGIRELTHAFKGNLEDIEGISFSGQMHGLVLLDSQHDVLRHAILWNDTRTSEECQLIYDQVGNERLLQITKNPALEGFTLPKLLWVKRHEPEVFKKAAKFLLPKDYVRFRLTNRLQMDYSDAAGTLLLDVPARKWSQTICDLVAINRDICPPLVASHEEVGTLLSTYAKQTGLNEKTRVFAGGADNACGAIGAGVLKEGTTMCSIGTSGVVLSYEADENKDFEGKVHYFNHSVPDACYTMGVTLSAGHSLTWLKGLLAADESFDAFLADLSSVPAGANGLLFTPYLAGERTPHADASIRASFIGMDASHQRKDFVRAVVEGITFSLHESIQTFRQHGKKVDTIISIGGGAKNEEWLQIQADIFNTRVVKLSTEQGPGMGAAMLAAYGCGWFSSLQQCANQFLSIEKEFYPNPTHVNIYEELFTIYQKIYQHTKELNKQLSHFRRQ